MYLYAVKGWYSHGSREIHQYKLGEQFTTSENPAGGTPKEPYTKSEVYDAYLVESGTGKHFSSCLLMHHLLPLLVMQ